MHPSAERIVAIALERAETQEERVHLEGCSSCRAEVARVRMAEEARLARKNAPPLLPFPARKLAWAAAAAGAVLVAWVGWVGYRSVTGSPLVVLASVPSRPPLIRGGSTVPDVEVAVPRRASGLSLVLDEPLDPSAGPVRVRVHDAGDRALYRIADHRDFTTVGGRSYVHLSLGKDALRVGRLHVSAAQPGSGWSFSSRLTLHPTR